MFTESRSLFGNIQPICVPCNDMLPTERARRVCPSDPTMCAYSGLNTGGHPADRMRVENALNQPLKEYRPTLPKIFEKMLESVESFCGSLWQPFIDAPNPVNLNEKDQLLSAAAQGY